jgi:hypothetical protein
MSAKAYMYAQGVTELEKVNKSVLLGLAWWAKDDGAAFRSVELLSADTGWKPTAVKRALRFLRDEGYLVQIRRGRANLHASDYRLTFKGAKIIPAPIHSEAQGEGHRVARRPFLGSPDDPQQYSKRINLTNQQEEEGEAKGANAPSLAIVSKQNPSLPSERSEDSEEKQKFRRKRDALVNVSPPGGSLEEWLTKLQYVCDNSPTLAGIDVYVAWERCCAVREERGLRRPTRQDFAGWLLKEWKPADAMVMQPLPPRYAAAC